MDRRWGLAFLALSAAPPVAAAAEARPGAEIIIFDHSAADSAGRVALPKAAVSERSRRQRQPSFEDRGFEALASPQLRTFSGDRELREYAREVRRIERQRWRLRRAPRAQAAVQEFVVAQAVIKCPDEACPEMDDAAVIVTGSRVAAPSITNNQVSGVDEGDIVKQIGDYLITLQDGRIFAVHYPSMRLTDRVDAFRRNAQGEPAGADWYDEMLVRDDEIIVVAYSYEEEASEISVLRLDQASGKIARRGVFLISSDDYYDIANYATRVVGDTLVIHLPYDVDDLLGRDNRPTIRRWQPGEAWEVARARSRSLLDSRDIYRPVHAIEEPVVHTIALCPLDDLARDALDCRMTAFVGGLYSEMFVSPESVYLWTSAGNWFDYSRNDCKGPTRAAPRDVAPGAVFRVSVDNGDLRVLGVRGTPFDQFSMDEFEGRFRSLVNWRGIACDSSEQPAQVALLDVARSAFTDTYREPRDSLLAELPSPGTFRVENRIVGNWLVYGGRSQWGLAPPEIQAGNESAEAPAALVAVPIDRPAAAQRLAHGHSVIRIERVGDDVVVNGYRSDEGLVVTFVDLEPTRARLASSATLLHRYETENRSHAFNSFVYEGGNGIVGVPTAWREEEADGYWWRSDVSDLSYLTFDAAGVLSDAGQILAKPEDEVETAEGYACEVSCVDWYGNSRPFFLGDKVYGLMATELVEAELVGGKVSERRRLDLTASPSSR